jgi:hypothetical protein
MKLESTSEGNESCNLRLEKLKMSTFDGDIRQYPRFKKTSSSKYYQDCLKSLHLMP